ncbi:T9SS type A sorting domain-containing protein [uncultured Marixanthomonas sp.]|uniref:T9SS type A sorting domain-containing protein n=1 Tax=uncultured Marixanthomonas sp. TaxID=757245 RepID=UPI0030D9D1C0|tara:strand:- start:296746 stop:298275 length:1530 start_codon:yes stop_codon:yes gene_type:complete
MKKINHILVKLTYLLIFTPFFLWAQADIDWQISLGGSGDDTSYSIEKTADNGYIVAGRSDSTDGDVSENQGQFDYWVVKLNELGGLEWEKSYGGTQIESVNEIIQTLDGGYIMAGLSLSNDGDVTTNNGVFDYWIVKIDSSGTIEWEKSYGGSGLDIAASIDQTEDGGYIIAGQSGSNDGDVSENKGGNDYWIVKIDSSGTIEWEKSYGGSNGDSPTKIKQTSDGGYIVTGSSASNDGDVTGNNGDFDIWLIKIDDVGELEWEKSFGGTNADSSQDLQLTSDGGFIVSGYFQVIAPDDWNYLVLKIDSNGEMIWEKSLGGTSTENAFGIAPMGNDGWIVSGHSNSTDGDVSENFGGYDYWLVKLDENGEIDWEQNFGGSGDEQTYDIIEANDGGFVITGQSTSNDIDLTNNNGGIDIWVLKIIPEDLGLSDFDSQISLYPNPVSSTLHINANNNLISKIGIYDALGKLVMTPTFSDQIINVSQLKTGIYFLKIITSQGKAMTKKIVKIK